MKIVSGLLLSSLLVVALAACGDMPTPPPTGPSTGMGDAGAPAPKLGAPTGPAAPSPAPKGGW